MCVHCLNHNISHMYWLINTTLMIDKVDRIKHISYANVCAHFKCLYNKTGNFIASDKISYLAVFLIAFTLRGIPEVIVGYYPIGYEIITCYAPAIVSFNNQNLIESFIAGLESGPLLYVLMWMAKYFTKAHPYLLLKISASILYGILALSFLIFLKKGLKFDRKMALVAAFILIFQPVTLRICWDRLRNVLGLIFLFSTLTALMLNHRLKWVLTTFFAIMTALSREMIAAFLFFSVAGFIMLEKNRLKRIIYFIPAFMTFLLVSYPYGIWQSYLSFDKCVNLIEYLGTVADVALIFGFGFLPLLPLVFKGIVKNNLLISMVAWLLVGSFSVIIIPWIAIPGYQRWLMLLVFPFSIFATNGLRRLQSFNKNWNRALTVGFLSFTFFVGIGYSTGTFSYIGTNSYIAVNMTQTTINWNQVDDVINCLNWLDNYAINDSKLLVEERFYGWTQLYLNRADNGVLIFDYGANSSPLSTLQLMLRDEPNEIYWIWYTDGNLIDFHPVYSSENICIFQYIIC